LANQKGNRRNIMQVSEILIVCATVVGPILAVQAQKAVERARERRGRKAWLFHSLMATRAARVSPEHVQALIENKAP